jgi:hypothetical protein
MAQSRKQRQMPLLLLNLKSRLPDSVSPRPAISAAPKEGNQKPVEEAVEGSAPKPGLAAHSGSTSDSPDEGSKSSDADSSRRGSYVTRTAELDKELLEAMQGEVPFCWGAVQDKWNNVWMCLQGGGVRKVAMVREIFKNVSATALKRHLKARIFPQWRQWCASRAGVTASSESEPL